MISKYIGCPSRSTRSSLDCRIAEVGLLDSDAMVGKKWMSDSCKDFCALYGWQIQLLRRKWGLEWGLSVNECPSAMYNTGEKRKPQQEHDGWMRTNSRYKLRPYGSGEKEDYQGTIFALLVIGFPTPGRRANFNLKPNKRKCVRRRETEVPTRNYKLYILRRRGTFFTQWPQNYFRLFPLSSMKHHYV